MTRRSVLICLWLVLLSTAHALADGDDLGDQPRRRPVRLWPPAEGQSTEGSGRSIGLGGWSFRAVRSGAARDGVPWELIVTPTGPGAEKWQRGVPNEPLPPAGVDQPGGSTDEQSVPIIVVPDILWKQRMDSDLQNVVGIHYHQFISDDTAHVLFTTHKVPPDNPDGSPPEPGSYPGRFGTRFEATLLAPLLFSLDQTILVRDDPLDKSLAQRRADHEAGHACVSPRVFYEILRGPQNWNLEYCTGRRSHVSYYWKREQIGRSWGGYQNGVGKLLTLRTTIALVPPTRWSKMIPIPPERVGQKHYEEFNEEIVHLVERFAIVDAEAQKAFHALHGEYEETPRD